MTTLGSCGDPGTLCSEIHRLFRNVCRMDSVPADLDANVRAYACMHMHARTHCMQCAFVCSFFLVCECMHCATMLADWLARGAQWFVLPRPDGDRCLVLATRGKTFSRRRNGALLHEFHSFLPNGNSLSLLVLLCSCISMRAFLCMYMYLACSRLRTHWTLPLLMCVRTYFACIHVATCFLSSWYFQLYVLACLPACLPASLAGWPFGGVP
jgi:hypothetical protein